jgi:heme exporter protein A
VSASAAMTSHESALLEARNLLHRYGSRVGLERVSFRAASPGVLAIRGANGSGKSTLLRILAGLLRPTEGEAALAIEGVQTAAAKRSRWIGYAAPDLAFYPEFTGAENLRFAAEARGLERPDEAVTEALQRVSLESRGTDRVSALSSGMVQRLRLAFALLHRPPILLMDEPGSHLDEQGRDAWTQLVQSERQHRLIVIATNEEREWTLADELVELRGRGLGRPA